MEIAGRARAETVARRKHSQNPRQNPENCASGSSFLDGRRVEEVFIGQ
jgi:hypothetical protein